MKYLYLSIAIVAEVVATNASNGFSKVFPSILVVLGYGSSFYFLSLALKYLPVGMVYATWAGLGIVLSTALAAFLFKQIPDLPAVFGMILIIIGVFVMSYFSKAMSH